MTELIIRATDLQVGPMDSSGFSVRIECADVEAVRKQILCGPDLSAEHFAAALRHIVEQGHHEGCLIYEEGDCSCHVFLALRALESELGASDGR